MRFHFRFGWLILIAAILISCSSGERIDDSLKSKPVKEDHFNQVIPENNPESIASPELVFFNAQIYTMDPDHPEVESIAISGDRILGIGANQEILSLAGDQTRMIDLQGLAVFPGFIDSHTHRITQRYKWGFDSVEEAARDALRQGWTGLTELSVDESQLEELIAIDSTKGLPIRVNTYLIVNSFEGEPLGDWYQKYQPGQTISSTLRIAGLKIFIDYDSGRILLWEQDDLNEFVCQRQSEGWQITMKAISIQAHELALGAYENCLEDDLNADVRHRIEHSISANSGQIARMAEDRITASIQPSFPAVIWNEEDIRRLSQEEGAENLFRWREYADAGVFLVSSPYNPPTDFEEYYNDSHLSVGGLLYRSLTQVGIHDTPPQDWMLDRALTLNELLPTLTINGAFATFEEQEKGSLVSGKLADLVVFSLDPYKIAPEDLLKIEVVMTVVGGNIEYCTPGFEEYCPETPESPIIGLHRALGKWQAVDLDGSSMTLELTKTFDDLTEILLFDQDARFCNSDDPTDQSRELTLSGQGEFVNNQLQIPDAMAKCVKIDKEMILEFSLEYDLKSDTMIDSTGVTWMRME
jgi:predicted amidohydrolase YtcJ